MTSMQVTLLIIFVPIIILLLLVSFLMLNGKGSFLIAGYNTMSKEEKARYKEKELTQFIGRITLIITLSFIFFVIGLYYTWLWMIFVFIGGLTLTCVYAIIGANSKKFKK